MWIFHDGLAREIFTVHVCFFFVVFPGAWIPFGKCILFRIFRFFKDWKEFWGNFIGLRSMTETEFCTKLRKYELKFLKFPFFLNFGNRVRACQAFYPTLKWRFDCNLIVIWLIQQMNNFVWRSSMFVLRFLKTM